MSLLMRLRGLPRLPLELFLWTRLALLGGAMFAYLALDAQYAQPLHTGGAEDVVTHDLGWGIDLWSRWDSGWFLSIADHGYADPGHSSAFFPAYPLLVRAVGWFTLGHYPLAGVLVSAAASCAAFVLLWKLARDLVGEEAGRRSVFYLAVFPTTLFLLAVYSESLYLLLSVSAFWFAHRKRWLGSGLMVGLAALTRVTGVVLLPALILLAWRAPDRRRALAQLGVSLPIMALWPIYLQASHGKAFVFLDAQRAGWDRHLSSFGPLGGAWEGIVAGWNGVRQLVAGSGHDYFPRSDLSPMYDAGRNLEQLGYAALLVALGVLAWKRLGAPYGLFVLASLALPLSDPVPSSPLLSMPRFALGVFPAFLVLGTLGSKRRVDVGIVAVSSILLGINLARWVLWQWVA